MLYDCWREIAQERQNELAVHELSTGRKLTFRQLADAAEHFKVSGGPVVFSRAGSVEFILAILASWRSDYTFCPLEHDQLPPVVPRVIEKNIVHLKTTSATTAAPRLVAFLASQLAADARNIVSTMGLRPEWPNLGVISLAHSYGFSNLVLPLVLHGIPLVLAESGLPENVRNAAAGYPALTLAGVPVLWRTWLEANAIPPSVRLAVSAGASLPISLEAEVFTRTGVKVHNFYGSSECGGIAYDRNEEVRNVPGLAGTAMDNVAVSIVEGCVEVRGDAVAHGYWPHEERQLSGGVFRTSDLAVFCGKELVLQGRASELINVAGRKISPESIERALATHPDVMDCVVFGAPADLDRGDQVVAWVALHRGRASTIEALRQHLMTCLPAWQIPREWQLMDSMPVNKRGKLSRSECRKMREVRAGGVRITPGSAAGS